MNILAVQCVEWQDRRHGQAEKIWIKGLRSSREKEIIDHTLTNSLKKIKFDKLRMYIKVLVH